MLDPREAIDRLDRAVHGRHPGHRALHAKGAFYDGHVHRHARGDGACAGPSALAATRAGAGALVERRRQPGAARRHPDIRGMAVKFQAPGGDTDLLGQTSPRFPSDDPEDFVEMAEPAVSTG